MSHENHLRKRNWQPNQSQEESFIVEASGDGRRLDKFLSEKIDSLSRTRIKTLIQKGHITIDGKRCLLPKKRLKKGQRIHILIPPPEPLDIEPQDIPLTVSYEDEHILVINKPPGLVVHPGAGNKNGTLVHGLLSICKDLSGIGGKLRPGIVHRLDKDTSGLMVIAKRDEVHLALSNMFKERRLSKTYLALIKGHVQDREGLIDLPIGRHPAKRTKMAVNFKDGRDAVTRFKVLENLNGSDLLEIRLLTGRTHQIRVHLSHLGHPILGDQTYGGPKTLYVNGEAIHIKRQMLHAFRLSFRHPVLRKRIDLTAPMPEDMKEIYEKLRRDTGSI